MQQLVSRPTAGVMPARDAPNQGKRPGAGCLIPDWIETSHTSESAVVYITSFPLVASAESVIAQAESPTFCLDLSEPTKRSGPRIASSHLCRLPCSSSSGRRPLSTYRLLKLLNVEFHLRCFV